MHVKVGQAQSYLAAWIREAVALRPRVINLVGPLGIGKTHVMNWLRGQVVPELSTFDDVDTQSGATTALRAIQQSVGGRFVVASRVSLRAQPGWGSRRMTTLELQPWSGPRIRALAVSLEVTDPPALDAVMALAAGIPLLAKAMSRALRAGVDPAVTGALADAAATVVLDRLRTETRQPAAEALSVVATVDGADEDLLRLLVTAPPDAFDRLASLSVVRPDVHGLTVAEPFRTILDLAYQWRHPASRLEIARRGMAFREGQIADPAPPLRARLAAQILYLSAHRRVHGDVFAGVQGDLRVRRADGHDADSIMRLARLWAGHEGLDARHAERMVDRWLAAPDHGFHVAVDPTDWPVGLVNISPLNATSAPALEPLLQQFSENILGDGHPGMLGGMLAVEPAFPRAQPLLVRHILHESIIAGRVVVSTPWVPYQQLSARFGLRRLGETRADVYRCGRHSAIYLRSFAPDTLPAWLRRLQGPHLGVPDAQAIETTRRSLARLNSPRAGVTEATRDSVLRALDALIASNDPVDTEAGRALHSYYVDRVGRHDVVAHRLHLSRATYFRRLEHGVRRVTELLI
ncbi:MAG TPA: hypothetical protein VFQ37_01200 [Mycobacterium sp.]|nr:hypothetical protein [Mycobacterium sp.]